MPQERGRGLGGRWDWEPGLSKPWERKGWDAGQKWEAGEELGRLAGDLELSLGVQGSTGRGEQGKVCMGGGLSAQAQSEGGAEAMF